MEDWTVLLAGRRSLELGAGRALRLLSAMEILEARREARELANGELELALCSNACLVARALVRGGAAVFSSGRAVLVGMTAREIGDLAQKWDAFRRAEDPAPGDGEEAVDALKKAWSTRLRRAFSGACSRLLGRCPPRRGSGR